MLLKYSDSVTRSQVTQRNLYRYINNNDIINLSQMTRTTLWDTLTDNARRLQRLLRKKGSLPADSLRRGIARNKFGIGITTIRQVTAKPK